MTETDCAADSFAAADEDVSTAITPQGGEDVLLGVRVGPKVCIVNLLMTAQEVLNFITY